MQISPESVKALIEHARKAPLRDMAHAVEVSLHIDAVIKFFDQIFGVKADPAAIQAAAAPLTLAAPVEGDAPVQDAPAVQG